MFYYVVNKRIVTLINIKTPNSYFCPGIVIVSKREKKSALCLNAFTDTLYSYFCHRKQTSLSLEYDFAANALHAIFHLTFIALIS